MPRLPALAAPLVLATALLPAAPVPPDADKPVYYFPTHVGTKWVYAAKRKSDEYAQIVTASEEKGGRFLVTVKTTNLGNVDFADDDTLTIAQYAVSKDGIFEVATDLESKQDQKRYEVPFCLLKLPHKDGNTWMNETHNEFVHVAKKIETVKVPAGTFESIRVEIGKDTVCWYAHSVGMVKLDHNDVHLELKSFQLPKK